MVWRVLGAHSLKTTAHGYVSRQKPTCWNWNRHTYGNTIIREVLVVEKLDCALIQVNRAPKELRYLVIHLQPIEIHAFGLSGPNEVERTAGIREVCVLPRGGHTWKVIHERKDGPDRQIECNPTSFVEQPLVYSMAALLGVTIVDVDFGIVAIPVEILIQANAATCKIGSSLRRRWEPGQFVHLILYGLHSRD
jgi:hypothetical protein